MFPPERSQQARGRRWHPIPARPRLPDSRPRPPSATGAAGWTPLPRRASGDSRTPATGFGAGPGGPGVPWSGPEAPRCHPSGRDRTRTRRDGFRSRRTASAQPLIQIGVQLFFRNVTHRFPSACVAGRGHRPDLSGHERAWCRPLPRPAPSAWRSQDSSTPRPRAEGSPGRAASGW